MIRELIRKNIQQLKPYSSAREEFKGAAEIFLDANENPYDTIYNRYPDPQQTKLRSCIAELKGVRPSQLFLGNGSDEAIDLLIRIFCEPGQDSILITEPTYGMYEVCAGVNGINVQRVLLTHDFGLDLNLLFRSITQSTKIIFLCSPNNPSGNLLERGKVEQIIQTFSGIVVIDEAYIDFANDRGFLSSLQRYPNLVILQTLSKAWGLAGLRLGIAIASEEIINTLNKIKYPYNINSITQQVAYIALKDSKKKDVWVKEILKERERVLLELSKLSIVIKIYSSASNFLLVKVNDAKTIYQELSKRGIVVRDRSSIIRCEECLRITIGTSQENDLLINTLKIL